MAYPVDAPRPGTKRRMARYFKGCRGGGQRINVGYLAAIFLGKTHGEMDPVIRIIEGRTKGWLIFATHDVCERPSSYGVTPQLFRQVVVSTVETGARIEPVAAVWSIVEGSRA